MRGRRIDQHAGILIVRSACCERVHTGWMVNGSAKAWTGASNNTPRARESDFRVSRLDMNSLFQRLGEPFVQ